MISLSQKNKNLKNLISDTIKNKVTEITNWFNGEVNNVKTELDNSKTRTLNCIYNNLPPKVGYYNEKNVNIQANFKSNLTYEGMYCSSDAEGMQRLFFVGYPSVVESSDTDKNLFTAYRANSKNNFTYSTKAIDNVKFYQNGTYTEEKEVPATERVNIKDLDYSHHPELFPDGSNTGLKIDSVNGDGTVTIQIPGKTTPATERVNIKDLDYSHHPELYPNGNKGGDLKVDSVNSNGTITVQVPGQTTYKTEKIKITELDYGHHPELYPNGKGGDLTIVSVINDVATVQIPGKTVTTTETVPLSATVSIFPTSQFTKANYPDLLPDGDLDFKFTQARMENGVIYVTVTIPGKTKTETKQIEEIQKTPGIIAVSPHYANDLDPTPVNGIAKISKHDFDIVVNLCGASTRRNYNGRSYEYKLWKKWQSAHPKIFTYTGVVLGIAGSLSGSSDDLALTDNCHTIDKKVIKTVTVATPITEEIKLSDLNKASHPELFPNNRGADLNFKTMDSNGNMTIEHKTKKITKQVTKPATEQVKITEINRTKHPELFPNAGGIILDVISQDGIYVTVKIPNTTVPKTITIPISDLNKTKHPELFPTNGADVTIVTNHGDGTVTVQIPGKTIPATEKVKITDLNPTNHPELFPNGGTGIKVVEVYNDGTVLVEIPNKTVKQTITTTGTVDINGYINRIFFAGQDYIICQIRNGSSNSNKILIDTNSFPNNPQKWTVRANNINSIFANFKKYVFNVLYFKEYGTVYVVGIKDDNVEISGELWKLSTNISGTPTLLKTETLFKAKSTLVSQNPEYDLYNLNWSIPHRLCIYNEDLQQLQIFHGIMVFKKDSKGQRSSGHNIYCCKFDCPKTHFQSGSGTLTNGFANADYKYNGNAFKISPLYLSNHAHLIYSSIDNKLYFAYQVHSSTQVDLYIVDAKTPITNSLHCINQGTKTSHVEPNDAAPWSKQMNAPIVVGNQVYFQATSKTYGWIYFYAQIDMGATKFYKVNSNRTVNWVSDGWYKQGTHGDTTMACDSISVDANSSQCYYVKNNEPYKIIIKDVVDGGVTFKNVKTLEKINGKTAPSFSAEGCTRLSNPYFFEGNSQIGGNFYVWYCTKYNSKVGNQTPCIVIYQVTQKSWKIFDNVSEYIVNRTKESLENKGSVSTSLRSNFFLEGTKLYFRFSFAIIGATTGTEIYQLDLLTGEYKNFSGYVNVWPGHPTSIGAMVESDGVIHKTYYVTDASWSPTTTGKMYVGSNSTFEKFLSEKSYNTLTFYCKPTTGLIAYMSEMPIFLGGYFSNLPVTEIQLTANAENYVFVKRNVDNHSVVDVMCTTDKNGYADNNFNSILVAKITTNTMVPTNIEYYDIDNY